MTIIVAVKDQKRPRVVLAADTLGSAGWDSVTRKDSKIFKAHGIGYGFTSSYRMGQILKYHSEEIKSSLQQSDPHAYMVKEMVPMWRDILKTHGYTTISNNNERSGTFIATFGTNIFMIDSDFQVGIAEKPYHAVGCGFAYALGSLYERTKGSYDANQTAKAAVESAMEFSNGCGGNIETLSIR